MKRKLPYSNQGQKFEDLLHAHSHARRYNFHSVSNGVVNARGRINPIPTDQNTSSHPVTRYRQVGKKVQGRETFKARERERSVRQNGNPGWQSHRGSTARVDHQLPKRTRRRDIPEICARSRS